MKYKVGDKVKVREDLVAGKLYGSCVFNSQMYKYRGGVTTIKGVKDDYYYLDKCNWSWTDEMLEDVTMDKNEGIAIFVDGKRVLACMGDKEGIAQCSPEDEFDFFVGAKLALERLEEKCTPYAWLQKGMLYYFVCLHSRNLYDTAHYSNDEFDKRMKKSGLVFKTKEEAIEAAKKMLAVLK